MFHSTTLTNRLTLWSLLCLALALSGGVFFCYSSYEKQLLAQLDSQLRLAAACFEQDTAPAEPPCRRLDTLATASTQLSEVAVYTSAGQLLCAVGSGFDTTPPTLEGQRIDGATPRSRIANGQQLRTLAVRLFNSKDGPVFVARANYTRELHRLRLFSAMALLAGLVPLILLVVLQRCKKSRGITVIRQLTRVMNRTDAENQPEQLTFATDSDPEVRNLATSYNALIERLLDDLRRSRQFTADVTHELRTPLTILRGETELALRSDRNREQLVRVLESNLEEISRMSYLIDDLLLLSKGDLGEVPLKMEKLDINGLVLELHHQSQLLAQSKNISVQYRMPPEQIVMQADSLRLRQVLLNLLTNAIRYTPDNGKVDIDVKTTDNCVEIAISDSGIGIAKEHLDKIFTRFYRIGKTRNRNDGGSGLGLAIVKWIVDAHNGRIDVQSTPGQGSCFRVRLPLPPE